MVKKLSLLFLGLLSVGVLLMFAWYRIDGIPVAESENYLSGPDYTSTREPDGSLLFVPAKSNGHGLVIMHGALILPQSYAKSAAYFAALGYTVYLPAGAGRLSIAALDKTAEKIHSSGLSEWFFIGHSMGGMSSLELISSNGIDAEAIALWATAMPADYTRVDAPMLFIWGDTDGLLPKERLVLSQQNLPQDTQYITLEGANHKNFAMYSHQFFDLDARIDWMEQIDFANETTARFFAAHL